MGDYATIDDICILFRPLSADETKKAEALLPVVSASLRYEADKVGKDLDKMIAATPDLAVVAKSVTVDVVARALMTPTERSADDADVRIRIGVRCQRHVFGAWRWAFCQKERAGPIRIKTAEVWGD